MMKLKNSKRKITKYLSVFMTLLFSSPVFADLVAKAEFEIVQVDNNSHSLAIRVLDSISEAQIPSDFLFVDGEGRSCNLNRVSVDKNLIIASSEKCPLESSLRVGQKISSSFLSPYLKEKQLQESLQSSNKRNEEKINFELNYSILSIIYRSWSSHYKNANSSQANNTAMRVRTAPLIIDANIYTEKFGLALNLSHYANGGEVYPYWRYNSKIQLGPYFFFIKQSSDAENRDLNDVVTSTSGHDNSMTYGLRIKYVDYFKAGKFSSSFGVEFERYSKKDSSDHYTFDYWGANNKTSFLFAVNQRLYFGPSLELSYSKVRGEYYYDNGTVGDSGNSYVISFQPFTINYEF